MKKISTIHAMILHIHLDIDVNLGAWVELRHHSSFESLLQVEAHLSGLPIAVRSPLPLRGAERGHTVLTVYDGSIVTSPTAGTSYLWRRSEHFVQRSNRLKCAF